MNQTDCSLNLTAFHIETKKTNVEGGGKITHGLRASMEENQVRKAVSNSRSCAFLCALSPPSEFDTALG
jgi:hypothetical protein